MCTFIYVLYHSHHSQAEYKPSYMMFQLMYFQRGSGLTTRNPWYLNLMWVNVLELLLLQRSFNKLILGISTWSSETVLYQRFQLLYSTDQCCYATFEVTEKCNGKVKESWKLHGKWYKHCPHKVKNMHKLMPILMFKDVSLFIY